MPLGLLENSAKGVDNSSLRPRFKVKYMQWMECMIRNKFLTWVLGELLFLDHAGFEFIFFCLVSCWNSTFKPQNIAKCVTSLSTSKVFCILLFDHRVLFVVGGCNISFARISSVHCLQIFYL
jgi:hypothetical protein